MADDFLSEGNLYYLAKRCFQLDESVDFLTHKNNIRDKATKWADDHEIYGSVPLGITTDQELLEYFNQQFVDAQRTQDPGNPARKSLYLQDEFGFGHKKYDEIQAQDYGSMDVRDPDDTLATADSNRHYRWHNKIPTRNRIGCGSQKVMMVEHDLDGLRTRNPDDASLRSHIRGFDMLGMRSREKMTGIPLFNPSPW